MGKFKTNWEKAAEVSSKPIQMISIDETQAKVFQNQLKIFQSNGGKIKKIPIGVGKEQEYVEKILTKSIEDI